MPTETRIDLTEPGPPADGLDPGGHQSWWDNGTVIGAVLILIGLLWTGERAGWLDLSATAVLALATVAVGVAAVVRSFTREHPGLITVGIVLATITALTAAAPVEGFQGGVGDRVHEIDTVAELDSDYELGAGTMVVDLSQLDDLTGTEEVELNVAFGELIVRVPPDVVVEVEARVGAGEITLFGRTSDGILVDDDHRAAAPDDPGPGLRIDANVLFGTVEVTDR